MSDKDRPKDDDGEGSGGGEEEVREGPAETEGSREGKCKGCGRKGKRLPFFRLRKSKKLLHQKRKEKGICVNSRGWGRTNGGGGWCCLCVGQPKTLDSSGRNCPIIVSPCLEVCIFLGVIRVHLFLLSLHGTPYSFGTSSKHLLTDREDTWSFFDMSRKFVDSVSSNMTAPGG